MTSYIYLGVAKNDVAPFVEIDMARSGRATIDHALALLSEHTSFERVEVWCDDQKIAVIERPGGETSL